MKNIALCFLVTLSLNACVAGPKGKYTPKKSYLQQDSINLATNSNAAIDDMQHANANKVHTGVSYITPFETKKYQQKQITDLTARFSNTKLIKITADDLPLKDYLHYILGDLLDVSYILGEQVKADNKAVTLNFQHDITQRKLFSISEQLLNQRGYVIRYDDGIFYIHKEEGTSTGALVYGYGNKLDNIPSTTSTIVQLVPFNFGMQIAVATSLKQLINIDAVADYKRNTLVLKGKKAEIIKAIEFVNLMDQPLFKNRQIAIYKTTYVSTDTLMEQLPLLLNQEGISVGVKDKIDKAVSLISLERTGTLVIFANKKVLLERAVFWAKKIDKAPSGTQLQYFMYQPEFARASDIGESLQLLIGGGNANVGSSTSAASQNKIKAEKSTATKASGSVSASNENMTLVVDERANSLIFNISGDKYRQLLSLIRQLDVMPKQVMLEMMIAEVKLSDEYKQGVDFVLTNEGDVNKVGGFNLSSGASGLSYVLSGAQGSLAFNLLQTNSNVNVLSRPSLLVRDGITASIVVGDDIPTVGEIITDPTNGSQTSVVYRKTGVELSITPTINARGVIIMEISQKNSSQVAGGNSVAGSPIIFERSIDTEVVAKSGQTIVLGGLISENRTLNNTSVPFLSSIPILGKLFDSANDSNDKTELVVLVTARVIESPEEWHAIKAKFIANFNELIF